MAFYDSALAAYDRFSQAIDSARLAEEKFEWQKGKDIETAGLAREKFAFEQFKAQRQEQIGNAKFAINKWTEQYNTIKSPTMRKHVVETLKQYHSSLPPWLGAAVEPIIKQGPISEQELKKQFFLETKPPPPDPWSAEVREFMGASSKSNLKKVAGKAMESAGYDDYVFAKQHFAYEDWKIKYDNFVFDKEINKLSDYVDLPTGGAAIRQKDDSITIYSQEDLSWKDLAEKHGTTVAELKGNKGMLKGATVTSISGGKKETKRLYTDALGQRKDQLVSENVEAAPGGFAGVKYPSSLVKFMENLYANSDSSKDYFALRMNKRIKSALKTNSKQELAIIRRDLSSTFGGFDFRIVPKPDPGLWDLLPFAKLDYEFSLIPIPGVKQLLREEIEGKKARETVIWVGEKDFVFDGAGAFTGYTLDQVQANPTLILGERK